MTTASDSARACKRAARFGHLTSLRERIQTDESVPALARELFAAQAEEYAQLHSQASRLPGGLRAARSRSLRSIEAATGGHLWTERYRRA